MPRFKCVACKTRLSSAGPSDPVGDLCPQCGSLLEPVGQLSEVVGFRSIKPRDSVTLDEGDEPHERIVDRLDDFLERRQAILAQARLDAQQWVDDDGSFPTAQAVAMPAPRDED